MQSYQEQIVNSRNRTKLIKVSTTSNTQTNAKKTNVFQGKHASFLHSANPAILVSNQGDFDKNNHKENGLGAKRTDSQKEQTNIYYQENRNNLQHVESYQKHQLTASSGFYCNQLACLDGKNIQISALDFEDQMAACDCLPNFEASKMEDGDSIDDMVQVKREKRMARLSRRLYIVREREQVANQKKYDINMQQLTMQKQTNIDIPEGKTKQVTQKSPQKSEKRLATNRSPPPHLNGSPKKVSIQREPISSNPEKKRTRAYLSPKVGSRIENVRKLKLRRGESIDVIGQQKRLNLFKTSEKSVSSNDNIAQLPEDIDDGNSIISEEDSAFNDEEKSPPYLKKSANKRDSAQRQMKEQTHVKEVSVQNVDGRLSRAPTNPKTFKRFETVGWKNHPTTNENKQPCRRSPTNKSGIAKRATRDSQDLRGSKAQFKFKILDTRESEIHQQNNHRKTSRNQQKQGAALAKSRNSSLNYMSDAMIDQLSMNFGKRCGQQKNKFGGAPTLKDSNSVISVITKGGTLNAQSGFKRSLFNASKIQSASVSPNKSSRKADVDLQQFASGNISQFQIRQQATQKSLQIKKSDIKSPDQVSSIDRNMEHLHYDMNLDAQYTSHDFKNTAALDKDSKIKVYLQAPYKVYSINDVNRLRKTKNGKDQQLYRAENLLNIHTQFRNSNEIGQVSQMHLNDEKFTQQNETHVSGCYNFSKDMRNVNLLAMQERGSFRHLDNDPFKTKHLASPRGSRQSQLSDTKLSAFFDSQFKSPDKNKQPKIHGIHGRQNQGPSLELDSQIWMNNTQYADQSLLLNIDGEKNETFLNVPEKYQRQKEQIKQMEFKKQFFKNLKEKILKRIGMLRHHANIYRKQQKLYCIYGGQTQTKELDQRDLSNIESSLRAMREKQMAEQCSFTWDINEVSMQKNDQSLRLSPDVMVNESSIQALRQQKLNNDSCDSLHQDSRIIQQMIMSPQGNKSQIDKESLYPQTQEIQPENGVLPMDTMMSQNNFEVDNLEGSKNQLETGGEIILNGQGDYLRNLIDFSKKLNLSLGMHKELQKLERQLEEAEKNFDQSYLNKEIKRFMKTRNTHIGNTSPKLAKHTNYYNDRVTTKSISKSFIKDSSFINFIKKPPVRMVSLQNKQQVQIFSPNQTSSKEENSLEHNASNDIIEQRNFGNTKVNLSPIKNTPKNKKQQDVNQSNLLDQSTLSLVVKETQFRSIEGNQPEVKEYFDKKISMRRSIDKKLHYDHIRTQVHYPANIQLKKHQKLLEDKINNQSQKLRQMTNNAMIQQVSSVKVPKGPQSFNLKVGSLAPQSQIQLSKTGIRRDKRLVMNEDLACTSGDANLSHYTPKVANQQVKFPLMKSQTKDSASKNQTAPSQDIQDNRTSEWINQQNGTNYLPQINGPQGNGMNQVNQNICVQNAQNVYSLQTPKKKQQQVVGNPVNGSNNILGQDQGILKTARLSNISHNNTVSYGKTAELSSTVITGNGPFSPLINSSAHPLSDPDKINNQDSRVYQPQQQSDQKKSSRLQMYWAQSQQSHHKVTEEVITSQRRAKGAESTKYPGQKHISMPELQQNNNQQVQMIYQRQNGINGDNNGAQAGLGFLKQRPQLRVLSDTFGNPGGSSTDAKKLAFQYKNKSPRVIPPGALKEIAYRSQIENNNDVMSPIGINNNLNQVQVDKKGSQHNLKWQVQFGKDKGIDLNSSQTNMPSQLTDISSPQNAQNVPCPLSTRQKLPSMDLGKATMAGFKKQSITNSNRCSKK